AVAEGRVQAESHPVHARGEGAELEREPAGYLEADVDVAGRRLEPELELVHHQHAAYAAARRDRHVESGAALEPPAPLAVHRERDAEPDRRLPARHGAEEAVGVVERDDQLGLAEGEAEPGALAGKVDAPLQLLEVEPGL